MARSVLALVLGLGALAAALLIPRTSAADPRTGFLIEQLRTNDDYRVRTQAALALGASGDDAAMKPLCDALGDSNASVKVAAAAALGKLGKPDGATCLKAAEGRETAPGVKAQIQKSRAALEAGKPASGDAGDAASVPAGAKFYVAIQVTNKTARPGGDVDSIIRSTIQDKLRSKAGYAIAPRGESTAQGGQIVKSKKLKGFFLIATVEPPVYDGGNLTQMVRVSMWSYPDKALQAEFSPKVTQSGTAKDDTKSETALMKICVENAIDTFHKVVASM